MNLLDIFLHRLMIDWAVFVAAVTAFWQGANPYAVVAGSNESMRFFNPFWTIFILTPLVLLPADWQGGLLVVLPLCAMMYLGRQLRYRRLMVIALLLSPALWLGITYGQIDWLVWLGLSLPTPLGLLILAIKPQATFVAMAVLVLRSRRPLFVLLPLMAGIVIQIAVFGVYLPDPSTNVGNSIQPWMLAVGLPLAVYALRSRRLRPAIAAGVLCSPYATPSSLLALSLAYPIIALTYLCVTLFK